MRWGDEAVAAVLRERGADETAVTDEDRSVGMCLAGKASDMPAGIALSSLDEMTILAIQGGHVEAMRRLLDAGARIDGDPDGDEVPLGQACWRGRVEMTRELVDRGASHSFRDGGSAIGAALHGSQHCHEPEGGPSMRPTDEIPRQPYAEIVRLLLDAGATIPERIGESGSRAVSLIAELGIYPAA